MREEGKPARAAKLSEKEELALQAKNRNAKKPELLDALLFALRFRGLVLAFHEAGDLRGQCLRGARGWHGAEQSRFF